MSIYKCFLFSFVIFWSVFSEEGNVLSETFARMEDSSGFFSVDAPNFEKNRWGGFFQNPEFSFEGAVSYFIPQSHFVRDIFGGFPFYRLEFKTQVFKGVYSYLSGGYAFSDGESVSGKSTDLYMIPCELGMLLALKAKRIHPYLGAGGVASYKHVNNESRCGPHSQSAWSYGGVFKLGSFAYLKEGLFLDLFLNYYLFSKVEFAPVPKNLDSRKVDLSGYSLGCGCGYSF